MIELTPAAADKIRDILAEESDKDLKLRIFVQGGGCSGFSYGFTLDHDVTEDDFQVQVDDITILIDAMSSQYLQGATVSFKDDLWAKEFVIINPNATSTCGCGSSFSV